MAETVSAGLRPAGPPGGPPDVGTRDDWRAALMVVLGLTLVRLVAIFTTPLDLYPDEAQYWLWSRTVDAGYFSKPPMIAWAIAATTALGGSEEGWVRLSAPLFQAAATLSVFAIGRRLYDGRTALAAAALYALMPAIQLSAVVAATDAPLLCFLGLTILAYVRLVDGGGVRTAAALGAALGLAFLSKYAAVYFLVGLGLHLALSRDARSAWSPAKAVAALAALAVVIAPNVAWNATHGFATVQHTAANAAWVGQGLFNPTELAEFVGNQFAVFGPIPFAVLIVGSILEWRRRKLSREDLLLLCFTLPPILIVSAQAFVSRANANWSGAGYLTGAILAAAWLIRWRARGWLLGALGVQALAAAVFLVCVVQPRAAETLGVANAFKRAKGWDQTTQAIVARARAEPGLTAVAVNNRFLYYAIAYYGRNWLATAAAPPLTTWLLAETPQNQAETSAPLTPVDGDRVLAVAYEGWRRSEMAADFRSVSGREIVSIRLDWERRRRIEMFVGESFRPRPRDPVSGLPTPP